MPDATSVYDAAGLRVAECVNDVWRFLIYDIGGKLVAEYGGVQPADEGGVKYVLSDWQGSTRAVVSNTGNVQSRSDYTAFGEEIQSGAGLRTATQGFGSANAIRQKYGLTERDDATGLDHTWFRKHENQAGRWTSPDPYNGSMSRGDPQSFNRYSYVANQPTNFVDPTGLLNNEWRCELWTTYHDPDGPEGPIEPVEVGPRFWQCYLIPSGGGPTAEVIVDGSGTGGGSATQAEASCIPGTVQIGIAATGVAGFFAGTIEGGIAIDTSGSIGLYGEVGGGSAVGVQGNVGLQLTATNAQTIDNLNGPMSVSGVSLAKGPAVTGNLLLGESGGNPIVGGALTLGGGGGASYSTLLTQTGVLNMGNVFDAVGVSRPNNCSP